MKLYLSNIEESYKYTIIGNIGNLGTADLLLHIVNCWSSCEINEEIQDLSLVQYCSHMMYKYYSCLGFSQNQIRKGKKSQ